MLSWMNVILITDLEFSQISEVVTLHFEEEDFSFGVLGVWNEWVVEKLEDIIADIFEFLFNFLSVLLDDVDKFRALDKSLI